MRPILVILALLSIAISSNAQEVFKFRTSAFSSKVNPDGKWAEWENAEILVIYKEDRFTIYSKKTQEYDIITHYDPYTDDDGDKVLKMKSVDQDGDLCTLRIISRKSGNIQLYVDFSNLSFVYNMSPI